MTFDGEARGDFDRAVVKAFWRQVISWLTGTQNKLLPYDEVKKLLPIQGQYYRGLQEIPISQIIGSQGRYRDFDRAFLPTQTRTKGRWMNIDKAHLNQIDLPPVDLYKMGEIYFVKDGNHRISVARERGQKFVDAYVTEIIIPIPLTSDLNIDELGLKKEYARFIEQTHLDKLRPGCNFESSFSGYSEILLEHISFHKWILGERYGHDVTYDRATLSWYDNVYLPITNAVRDKELLKEFPGLTETDLYIWIIKYQWYLTKAYREELEDKEGDTEVSKVAHKVAAGKLKEDTPEAPSKKLYGILRGEGWIIDLIKQQEYAEFAERTRLFAVRPDARITTSIPGQYEILLDHIAVHRWYIGEHKKSTISFEEAAVSWYDNVYLPLVEIIREKNILIRFPERTETDFYLWVTSHQAYVKEAFGSDGSIEKAIKHFLDSQSE